MSRISRLAIAISLCGALIATNGTALAQEMPDYALPGWTSTEYRRAAEKTYSELRRQLEADIRTARKREEALRKDKLRQFQIQYENDPSRLNQAITELFHFDQKADSDRALEMQKKLRDLRSQQMAELRRRVDISEAMNAIRNEYPYDPEIWKSAYVSISNSPNPMKAAATFDENIRMRSAGIKGSPQANDSASTKAKDGKAEISLARERISSIYVWRNDGTKPTQAEIDAMPDWQRDAYLKDKGTSKEYGISQEEKLKREETEFSESSKKSAIGSSNPSKEKSINTANLESDYVAHRGEATPAKVSRAERCLHSILFMKYWEYKDSTDYKKYTAGMSPVGAKFEYDVGLSVCGDEASKARIISAAESLYQKYGESWRVETQALQDTADKIKEKNNQEIDQIISKYPITPITESKAVTLECRDDVKQETYDIKGHAYFSRGEQKSVPQSDYDNPDETILTRAIREVGEAAAAKAIFSNKIAEARQSFFSSSPGSLEHDRAERDFGDLLFEKDLFYLQFYLVSGSGKQSRDQFDAINVITGGEIDGGISAMASFGDWVTAVRGAAHPGNQLWIPMPDELTVRLQAAQNYYASYKSERDRDEFIRWRHAHEKRVTSTDKVELANRYFGYYYDPRINETFCSADNNKKEIIKYKRKKLRALILASEDLKITPETVFTAEFSTPTQYPEEQARRKQVYMEGVEARRRQGRTDEASIALEAIQDTFRSDSSHRVFTPPALGTVESQIRLNMTADIIKGMEKLLSDVGGNIPLYGNIRSQLVSDERPNGLPRIYLDAVGAAGRL